MGRAGRAPGTRQRNVLEARGSQLAPGSNTNTAQSSCAAVFLILKDARCLRAPAGPVIHPPGTLIWVKECFQTPPITDPLRFPVEAVALLDISHAQILHIILVFLIAPCGSFHSQSLDFRLKLLVRQSWKHSTLPAAPGARPPPSSATCSRQSRSYPGMFCYLKKKSIRVLFYYSCNQFSMRRLNLSVCKE